MNIKELILKALKEKKELKVADIVKATGFSRVYINRFFRELKDEGKIVLIGRANRAHYVLAGKRVFTRAKKKILTAHRILKNKNLSEDVILDEIKQRTGIFLALPKNISSIVDYVFTEILNNAIEHSKSKKIDIFMNLNKDDIKFTVVDHGIGIFRHIMRKKKLENELEAIQDLLKGKQTTAPKEHTGEGIFFSSKAADILMIRSFRKKLVFHNILNDTFIENVNKSFKGTQVAVVVLLRSKRQLDRVFKEYSGGSYEFSKTRVKVKLFKMDTEYISRSQARRVVSGLEKFKIIVLDFIDVEVVGQAFADEIFRVWKRRNPAIKIVIEHANENIRFMIDRVRGGRL